MDTSRRLEASRAPARATGLLGVHALLGAQSVVIVLASVNRLSALTTGYVLPNEYLRWVDWLNMLVFPLASLLTTYALKRALAANEPAIGERARWALSAMFFAGAYLTAASYGAHEVTNYLHIRFCLPDPGSTLCSIIAFTDDEFSHHVFFAGFTLVNAFTLLWQVAHPHRRGVSAADAALLAFNALFIAAGIFANLAFEEIGLDLVVVAVLAAASLALLWRHRGQPLLIYYAVAYMLGLGATAVYRALAR